MKQTVLLFAILICSAHALATGTLDTSQRIFTSTGQTPSENEQENAASTANASAPQACTCSGTWILRNPGLWLVQRTQDGLILPVPGNATILGCRGQHSTLEDYLNGTRVDILCTNATASKGGPHVHQVHVICE